MLDRPLQIGPLAIPNRAVLAPLAGVSDVPFRRICQELGAGLTFVEMLSAVALQYNSRRTMEMLSRHASESVLGVQVTGPKPEGVASCVRMLDDLGFDAIDINMGCPVRKVVGSGSGSAFLKDLARIEQTVLAARAMTAKALTVKVRLGFTPESVNVEETAAIIARCGADMITVHGRTREDSYAVRVSYPGIAAGLRAARSLKPAIATLGNGDVMDVASGLAMVRETSCDGVMVSRGALGNPWIFRDLVSGVPRPPSVAEWEDVVLRHMDYHAAHYGDNPLAARLTRKHLIWYSSGLPHANRFRESCNQVSSMQEARDIVRRFAAQLPRDARRFEDSHAAAGHEPKFEMDRQLDRGVGDDRLPSAGPGPAAG